MRKYLAFDIETAKPFPEDREWRRARPLGIACAATWASGATQPRLWAHRDPDGNIGDRISPANARALVEEFMHLTEPRPGHQPHTLLTWNGLGFDLDILAEESGMLEECRHLALNHVDMMFHIYATLGYPVGLGKAAQGMGTPGKPEGMNGAIANDMWTKGNRQPVLDYCGADVQGTRLLADECERNKQLRWTSNRGNPVFLQLETGWMTVKEALELPEPDKSWMTNPIPKENFTGWLTP